MKVSKKSVKSKTSALPIIQFQEQKLTSYSGATLFKPLFDRLHLQRKLNGCFSHLKSSCSYRFGLISLVLIVHLMLGYRKLQDLRFYNNDPIILRVLGINKLPDSTTVSRRLGEIDAKGVDNVRALNQHIVLDRLAQERFARLTVDFDGTVLSTARFAEGSAVGFNRKKKGQRSYYPLAATVAQVGQVLDVWHRPGNVHDSNGAGAFISSCLQSVKSTVPKATVETRMDSAFFSEAIVDSLHNAGVEFSVTVPFAKFTELKTLIQTRQRWHSLDDQTSFFEAQWKPKSWGHRYRFVFVRSSVRNQRKGAIQLDLFEPIERHFEYKVIITNKRVDPRNVIRFHDGRGYQENLFSELKSQMQLDYIPTNRLYGNQLYTLSSVIAHNLGREMQMSTAEPERKTTEKRAPLWVFEKFDTIRRKFIQQAGRLTSPRGKLTLTMNKNEAIEQEFMDLFNALTA